MAKTDGEKLFEEYLLERSLTWKYEQPTGTTQPDYLVDVAGGHVLCEVKDFDENETDQALIATAALGVDPYARIRKKINRAREQFRPFKGRGIPCVLVLHNSRSASQSLEGFAVYGAMFGNLGFEVELAFPHNTRPHIDTATATVRRLKNTTISAVAVLDRYRFNQPLLDNEVQKRIDRDAYDKMPEAERTLRAVEDIFRAFEEIQQEHPNVDFDATAPRIRWVVNPHAAVPLAAIFQGPHDKVLEPLE